MARKGSMPPMVKTAMPVASGRVAFSSRLIGVQKAKTQYTSWMTMLNKARPRTVRWGERTGRKALRTFVAVTTHMRHGHLMDGLTQRTRPPLAWMRTHTM